MVVFSIVTVVKNDKDGLEKTILSLKKQSYPNIEYIVVDGASTDGTLDVIKKNLDIITKWESELDDGLYYAMNKGKDMATGDFVIFINSGDIFHTDTTFSDIYNGMSQDKNQLYFGKVTLYNKDVSWEYKPHEHHDNKNYLPHHQATFYPLTYYRNEYYNTNFKIMGDVDFTIRAAKMFKKQYIPVTTIHSELNGYGINMFKNLKGVKLYIKDFQLFHSLHPASYTQLDKAMVYIKAIIKYISFKVGGTYILNILIAKRLKLMGSIYNSLNK